MTGSLAESPRWLWGVTTFLHAALWAALTFLVGSYVPALADSIRTLQMKVPYLTERVLTLTDWTLRSGLLVVLVGADGFVITWLHRRGSTRGILIWLAAGGVTLIGAIVVVSNALITALSLMKGLQM